MFEKLNDIQYGYNVLTEMNGRHKNMMMDIGIYKFKRGEKLTFKDEKNESAFLILSGQIKIKWERYEREVQRLSLFDESPWCLHVSCGVSVEFEADVDSEIIIQKTENSRKFESKLYTPNECRNEILGDGVWNDTSRRVVRTVFDYSNAPYSNMVIGEVITYPGKWSSYPPHSHPQPEAYYYRFDKSQGFGCCVIGDDVFKITDNSLAAIPGGFVHPQTSAPGYAMYYCWMIRHLDGNPWTDRMFEDSHKWLLEKDVKIWPEK